MADADRPAIEAHWAAIGELDRVEPESVTRPLDELVRLAHRASAGGEHLYCWIST